MTVPEDPAVQIIATALAASWATDQAADVNVDADAVASALRAAGYPLNPDEVSVPRASVDRLMAVLLSEDYDNLDLMVCDALDALPDALVETYLPTAVARLDPSTKENA